MVNFGSGSQGKVKENENGKSVPTLSLISCKPLLYISFLFWYVLSFFFSAELTKLWNVCPDNLEACRGKDRDFLPSLDSYFEEAIEQTDPSAMVEDSYKYVCLQLIILSNLWSVTNLLNFLLGKLMTEILVGVLCACSLVEVLTFSHLAVIILASYQSI